MASDMKNTDERLQIDNIKITLRNMIKSFEYYAREAKNYEQLEESLKHMEETDENFHKYELVEDLNEKLENLFGALIDKHVNDMFINTKTQLGDIENQNKYAKQICDEIIFKTHEFIEFKTKLSQNVSKVNDHLVKNYQNLFKNASDSEVILLDNTENKSISFTNDFEYMSPDNSMNQNSFVFFNSEQFPTIAENLDPRKPENVRLKAMHQLLSIPANDPPAAEFWNKIRKHLVNALKDPNENIADLCLHLHSRTLGSSHPTVSKEIFSSLTEHISEYFIDKELEKRSIRGNIDMTSGENLTVLRKLRLVNDYAKEVSKYWIRYSETFVKSIINDTLKLFDIVKIKFGSFLTPIHYLSLFDIQASWFIKWMHGHDSRKLVLEEIQKHETFLQNAIYSILTYSNSKRIDSIHQYRKKSTTTLISIKRTMYRKCELDFCHFIHSLTLVTKLLNFKNGRKLFPIKVNSKDISIKELMKSIIQILFDQSISKSNLYSPPKYTCNLLLDLCSAEDTCEACFCHDDVIDLLLKPVRTILQLKRNSNTPAPYDESCITHMANILSKLASTESGYRQLLFGELKTNIVINKNSAAYTVMLFIKKALTNQLPLFVSNMEIGEYLYLARLLYSQCQGTNLLKEFDLYKSISDTWKTNEKEKVINPSSTPRQSINSGLDGQKTLLFSWSDSLLDSLLCMASTPKGVVYLNETGLIKQTINYMVQRYKMKSQVGKYEKFGYGYMMSQLSNTASGCYHLNESNLIQHLIDEIWTELEYGSNDDFLTAFPRSYPTEAIDRFVYKPLLCLMNILSSFSAVYEILNDVSITPRNQYSVREIPEGLIGLLDRLVFIDKDIKIQSLFNYEQSHTLGLRLLSYLQSDLDVLLLLEAQYASSQCLLDNQKMVINEENGEIIRDLLSLERNYVLIHANLIGGSNERIIPVKTPDYPLFSELPVPNFYIKNIIKQDEILGEMPPNQIDEKWLQKYRKNFSTNLKNGNITINSIGRIFSILTPYMAKFEANTLFNSNSNQVDLKKIDKSCVLSQLQSIGVQKVIDYGCQIKLLPTDKKHEYQEELTTLLRGIKALFKQKSQSKSKLNYIQDSYPGFDWFISTIFLIYKGNLKQTWEFLQQFQKLNHSAFLWPARLYSNTDILSQSLVINGISINLATICHYIEYIMRIELPFIFSAFKMSGLAPSQICSHWLKQCFWNYFDFNDICVYLLICLLFGIDYQVYFCLSLLNYLSNDIIKHYNDRDLLIYLKETQIKGFRIEQYMDYMSHLEKKYRQFIISDIKDFFNYCKSS